MLTYSEVILLRDKLASGEIGLEAALGQYWKDFKEEQKSWDTKDWKDRRSKIIKDKCEICSSSDTLTLQHLSHPKKYSGYLREVTKAYAEAYINTNPHIDKYQFSNYILNKYDYVPVPLCPNCKSSNPNKRVRKVPQYRCTVCRHEFDNPVYKSVDELISIFMRMKTPLKCGISALYQRMNGETKITYQVLNIGCKENGQKIKMLKRLEKRRFRFI